MTITNTGTAALQFTNWEYSCWFINSGDSEIYQPYPSPITGYPAPTVNSVQPWTLSGFGSDDLGSPSTSGYLYYLDNTWSDNWVANNAYLAGATLPPTLAPSASFTYVLWLGLGNTAPYGIPGMYYSISIPLTAIP